jgi:hypothetical protein
MKKMKALAIVGWFLFLLAWTPHVPAQSGGSTMPVETVEISKRWGFHPAVIHHTASGQLCFIIRNATGLSGLEFQLTNTAGTIVKDWTLQSGQNNVVDTVNSPAGTYTLSVVNHPGWVFTLVLGS